MDVYVNEDLLKILPPSRALLTRCLCIGCHIVHDILYGSDARHCSTERTNIETTRYIEVCNPGQKIEPSAILRPYARCIKFLRCIGC